MSGVRFDLWVLRLASSYLKHPLRQNGLDLTVYEIDLPPPFFFLTQTAYVLCLYTGQIQLKNNIGFKPQPDYNNTASEALRCLPGSCGKYFICKYPLVEPVTWIYDT
jgi:hypothetical protein